MNKRWLVIIFTLSYALLCLLEVHRQRQLNPYFKAEKSIKLNNFSKIKKDYTNSEQELLELWESMLTGRVAPVSQWMKERYKNLGLTHLFTPSGFHLSAVLYPFMKFIKSIKIQLSILVVLGGLLLLVPGQGALKRMILVKSHQKVMGLKIGFIFALIMDTLFGTFQSGALSFTYSFLFLGIIYSGLEGAGLIFWFFIAQMTLAYFQGTQVSPLLIIFSPILNFAFGLSMPILFLLAIPLWSWQAEIGLFILKSLQMMVDFSARVIDLFPIWEIHLVTLALIVCFVMKKKRAFLIILFLFTSTLNWDLQKKPGPGRYDFHPIGEKIKTVNSEERDLIYFSDGKCDRRLVRGFWYERCSPKKRSTRSKKIMKLSSL